MPSGTGGENETTFLSDLEVRERAACVSRGEGRPFSYTNALSLMSATLPYVAFDLSRRVCAGRGSLVEDCAAVRNAPVWRATASHPDGMEHSPYTPSIAVNNSYDKLVLVSTQRLSRLPPLPRLLQRRGEGGLAGRASEQMLTHFCAEYQQSYHLV